MASNTAVSAKKRERALLWRNIYKFRALYIMMLPGIAFFIIFRYAPMWGLLMAFQNFNPFVGIMNSPWVGFDHFVRFMNTEGPRIFRNTFILAFYNLVFFFPVPIILALMINEIKNGIYKRVVQSIIYIPHFISWVVVISLFFIFFNGQDGIFNIWMASMGRDGINPMLSEGAFRPVVIIQLIWKNAGWGTIIFLAALAGVDVELYEAAYIDGATRARRIWHITLPSIRSTIVVMMLLRVGSFLDTGFDQIFLMLNAMNRTVGDVFDTYIYQVGLLQGLFSYSTAVGFFRSVVALILILVADFVSKRLGESGVF